MGRRIRDHDWSRTPFGPLETWPSTLRTALGLCLGSTFPTAIYWGPELRLLYNDAWAPIPAERHPACLGQAAADVWYDIWDVVGPQFADVMATGEGFAAYDQPLTFIRDGAPVDTWFNYSFSAIRDDGGVIAGIFNQGNETTRLVLAQRAGRTEADRLHQLFNQAPGAVALIDVDGLAIAFANALTRQLIGDDIIGRRLAEVWPEMVEGNFFDVLDRVITTGEAYRATAAPVPLPRRDGRPGETRLLDFVYQPIRDAAGDVVQVFVQANDVTDRVRAERALHASEERLQLALDSSLSIGTWDWDVPGNLVTSDARFARLYGVDPDLAARGAPIETFFSGIHPDDLPRVQAAIEDTLTTGAPFIEEYRLAAPGGRIIWVVTQGRATFDAKGRPVRFPGISFDITKRRLAEEAARDAANDLRAATEAQAFVYRLTDQMRRLEEQGEIMRLAATALGRRLGADRVGFLRVHDDVLMPFGSSWTSEAMTSIAAPIPLDQLDADIIAAYQAGETRVIHDYSVEAPHLSPTVRQRAGAGIGVPLRRQERWVAGLYVNQDRPRHWTADEVALAETVAETAWDAVDRTTAAAALRESEAKFRAIANSIDQMVWSTLPDGYHDYYNQRWYDFTGVPQGSTDGEAWNGMFHPDDQQRAWAAWNHSLTTGDPYRIEYRLRHRSGDYRWVLGSALPVHDDGGRIVRWFGTCTDIEEIVEARNVLARSRRDLEAAIVERTGQLMATEAQLRQSQKMEAVGQLTGGIAHDFNNMLAVVIGALDLLERRIAQGRSDVGRYVEAARDGATRAAALTQRLLTFSRRSALEPVPTDLSALVDGMAELLSRTLGEAIQVETHLDPAPWIALTDPSQLENAILNLAVNARDAMPEGGRLTIATANIPVSSEDAATFGIPAGDYLSVAVSDTGVGMVPDVAARAFDPFFTTKSVGKGTGLGLSQVFGFVHQSGGHVAIDSTPGDGTTIRILLPRDVSDRTPAPVPREAVPVPRATAGEVILVVEDEDRVRSYSTEALADLGYTVLDAHDGPSALRLIEQGERIDLLFTDVVMPEMTGRQLAEAARWHLPGLRVLYTSGYTREGEDHGGPIAAGVLTKPFDVATLANRVRDALDGEDAAR